MLNLKIIINKYKYNLGRNVYNYFVSSSGTTCMVKLVTISEWRLILTLKLPSDLISLTGWICDGAISSFSVKEIIFEISVGFTEP